MRIIKDCRHFRSSHTMYIILQKPMPEQSNLSNCTRKWQQIYKNMDSNLCIPYLVEFWNLLNTQFFSQIILREMCMQFQGRVVFLSLHILKEQRLFNLYITQATLKDSWQKQSSNMFDSNPCTIQLNQILLTRKSI